MTSLDTPAGTDLERDGQPDPVDDTAIEPRRDAGQVGLVATLVVVGLVLNIFSGESAALGLPLSPDRPILLLALVLLVIGKRPRWRRTPLVAVMLATVVWTFVSWMSTGTLTDSYRAFGLTDRILVPFLMFLIGPAVFDTPARRDLLLKMLTVVGIYLGLTGLAQYLGAYEFVYPTYARFLVGGVRAGGPFSESGVEAQGMACVITMVAGAVLAGRRGGVWRVLGLAALVASAIGVTVCQTRSTWVAGAAALVLLPLLIPRLRKWIVIVWAGMAGVVALVAYEAPSLVDELRTRADDQGSVLVRVLSNAGAVRAVDAHPLTGIGWLRFQELHADWVVQSPTLPFGTTDFEVHNVFLSRAAETGIIGAVLWGLAVLMGPVAAILVRPRTGEMLGWRMLSVGAFFAWLVPSLSSPNPYPFPNFLFWLIAGITAAPLVLKGEPDVDEPTASPLDEDEVSAVGR